MSLSLRPATVRDEAEIQRVIRAVYDEYGFTWDPADYHADLYDLDAHYLAQGHRFWLAESAGRLVGTVALERFDRLPGDLGGLTIVGGKVRVAGADCSMERLYVHPASRRQGAATALIEAALGSARADGRTALELWSDKRFGDAHRLYGRFGAEVVGERLCDDPDVSAEWGLLIRLA